MQKHTNENICYNVFGEIKIFLFKVLAKNHVFSPTIYETNTAKIIWFGMFRTLNLLKHEIFLITVWMPGQMWRNWNIYKNGSETNYLSIKKVKQNKKLYVSFGVVLWFPHCRMSHLYSLYVNSSLEIVYFRDFGQLLQKCWNTWRKINVKAGLTVRHWLSQWPGRAGTVTPSHCGSQNTWLCCRQSMIRWVDRVRCRSRLVRVHRTINYGAHHQRYSRDSVRSPRTLVWPWPDAASFSIETNGGQRTSSVVSVWLSNQSLQVFVDHDQRVVPAKLTM